MCGGERENVFQEEEILCTDRIQVGTVEMVRVWVGGQMPDHIAPSTPATEGKMEPCSQGNQESMMLKH